MSPRGSFAPHASDSGDATPGSEPEPPAVEWDEDIPAERPSAPGGGESEVPDQPLGPPDDLDADDAPSPGLPEAEPPSSG